ncbi:Ldlrap1-b protein [Elysia marginata]|uniref:Ldlrap1-b protein n=1 Tax=Elysia marginata TaxID=1093978 RepID=A0AAV4JHJ8_9GAST|nr:Ldlrap1-b protein [Elysia marginata]
MAAAVAEISAGTATLASEGNGYSNLPVTWASAEDAIEDALTNDPDLLTEISSKLDTDLVLTPDRKLTIEDDEESNASESAGGLKDSDTASTSSSLRDAEDNSFSNGDDISPRKGSIKTVISINKTSAISSQIAQVKEEDASSKLASSKKKSSPRDNSSPSSSSSSAPKGKEYSKTGNGDIVPKDKNRKSHKDDPAHDKRRGSVVSGTASDTGSASSGNKASSSSSGSKNPLKLLKRLTKFEKNGKKTDHHRSEFSAVVIDRLPQVFVAKYLGHRDVSGICGLQHVRKPVDQMVKSVKEKLEQNVPAELPLLYVVISPKGIDLREHKQNKIKDIAPLGVMPIDFISYGVQDIKFWRVFTCIVVQNMSSQSRSRTAVCHAFLCDSAHNGRKMALSLGAAFGIYSKKLQASGVENNFRVELRPPDELADEIELDV